MGFPYIWAGLQRATNDPTTIDQAIADGVEQHNNDPAAHLGADQSLQSHRASEIIDHRAESVVNDKIARMARRYVAIVDPNSDSDFDTVQGAIDYASGIGGGDIFVVPGVHAISSDVLLPRTCGLYGSGDGESIIVSDSSTERVITIQETSGHLTLYCEDIVCNTSSKNFSVGYFEETWESYMVGLPLFDTENSLFLGFVASFDPVAKTGVFADNAANNAAGVVGYMQPGAYFTNGSNAAQLVADPLVYSLDYYAGATIMAEWESERYLIIAHEENQTLVLAKKFTGTSGLQPCFASDTAARTVNIEGLQIGDDQTPTTISGTAGQGSLVIRDCTIRGGNTPVSLYGTVLMDNVNIDMGTTTNPYAFGKLSAENCKFRAVSSTPTGITIAVGSRLRACIFGDTNNAFANPIAFPDYDCVVDSCTFRIRTTWSPTMSNLVLSTRGITVQNCFFDLGSSAAIVFSGRHWLISGCRFDRSSGSGVTLSSTCSYSIFVNNITGAAITNSGTGNVVANGVTKR